jgi:hypothetical protein
LSITHRTRKPPSTGPQATHGPQYPPWWVHWQHTHIVTWEKRKRKEMNKTKLQQTPKSKITWRRQVSGPLGKGNGSTHPRQNPLKQRAQPLNQSTKTIKSSPCTHASSPWANGTSPRWMHANHLKKTWQMH